MRCILADSQKGYVQEFPPKFSIKVNSGKEHKLKDAEPNSSKKRTDNSILIKEDLIPN